MADLMGVSKFELLFRRAANLDIDKSDLKRLNDFIAQEVYDLLLIGKKTAQANNRDIILVHDLPITRGLEESIADFNSLDTFLELSPILEQLAILPNLEMEYTVEVEERLPEIVGALVVSLAKTFKQLDPEMENPQADDWERAFNIFSLLL